MIYVCICNYLIYNTSSATRSLKTTQPQKKFLLSRARYKLGVLIVISQVVQFASQAQSLRLEDSRSLHLYLKLVRR